MSSLTEFATNPRWLGGIGAFTLVLHTWTQDLRRHLHVHALMACGALQLDAEGGGRWCAPRRAPGFLFPVHALSRVFRGKFLQALHEAAEAGTLARDPACTEAARQQRLQASQPMRELHKLIDRWRREGVVLLPPEPASVVRESFEKIGATLTSDVVALYAVLGGMQEMDREYWRLWSLPEVRSENAAGVSTSILFSDYLINCWSFRLVPTEDDTSSVVADYFDYSRCIPVASSLEGFFRMYPENPYQVLEGPLPNSATSGDA
jgi:hypothetical protein